MPVTTARIREVLTWRLKQGLSHEVADMSHTLERDKCGRSFLRLLLTMSDGVEVEVDAYESNEVLFLYEAGAQAQAIRDGVTEPPKLNA